MDRARTEAIEWGPAGRYVAGASDEELVAAALIDARHFDLLYERYADRLYRYALGRTGSTAVADDIVSETMIAALENLERFDSDRGSFTTWLFTIASRRIIDRGRARSRFWRAINRRWRPDPPGDSALDLALRSDEQARVRLAVERLSERHREVVTLRYVADLPISAIADVLGISEGAVKMRLNRALKQLADDLGDDRDDD